VATSGVKSGVSVAAAQCSCARVVRWKAKVTSSLTDVWQKLFEQRDITIHFHLWLHENHTSAPAPGYTDWNWHAGKCLSETSEGRQWAEAASDWNVVSNQQSFIEQATDQWKDCFNACLKVKSKNRTFAMMCFSVTVMTFKAYATAVINKLSYVSFHKVGWEQPSWEVGNFVVVFLQIYFSICVPKIIEIYCGLTTKLLQK